MRILTPFFQLLLVPLFLCSSAKLSAQSELVAYMPSPDSQNQQPLDEFEAKAIIVDTSVRSKAYPTMEEEMAMYVKLQAETPQAYFFPSPSNGIIWIEHNLGKTCTVSIEDQERAVVFTASNLKAKKLDLTGFKAGQYRIVLSNDSHRVVRLLEVR